MSWLICILSLQASLPLAPLWHSQEPGSAFGKPSTDKLPPHAVLRLGRDGDAEDRNGVHLIQFSPASNLIAVRMRDQSVRVHDLSTGRQLCEVQGHKNYVKSVVFSPDSQTIVTAGQGDQETIKFWNATTGELLRTVEGGATDLKFSTDGSTLHALGETTLRQINTASGEVVRQQTWREGNEVALALSADVSMIAKHQPGDARRRQNYFEIQVERLNQRSSINLVGQARPPLEAVFAANGRWVVGLYQGDSQVCVWNLAQSDPQHRFKDHSMAVRSVAISRDSRFVATASFDKSLMIWDLVSGRSIATLAAHSERILAVAFSPDSRFVASGASGASDSSAIVWELHPLLFPNQPELPEVIDDALVEKIWSDLGSEDPREALDAVNLIVACGPPALPHIDRRVSRAVTVASQDEIVQLIGRLDDAKFAVREQAERRLLELRPVAESFLRQALENNPSAEMRIRITRIINQPIERPSIDADQWRRWHRVVFALELLDGRPARDLLRKIAFGHPHIDVSREAVDTLQRLGESTMR